jgi:serine/threonine protein kinase
MNRYVLEERIGEGTFGTVYRAKKKGDPVKVRKQPDSKVGVP